MCAPSRQRLDCKWRCDDACCSPPALIRLGDRKEQRTGDGNDVWLSGLLARTACCACRIEESDLCPPKGSLSMLRRAQQLVGSESGTGAQTHRCIAHAQLGQMSRMARCEAHDDSGRRGVRLDRCGALGLLVWRLVPSDALRLQDQ